MSIKILIVEDDIILNEMYSMKFAMDEFEVESAFNGVDGLEKIKNFRPDVILLDIMMPGINGLDIISLIKYQADYDLKIIMFTNLNDKENIEIALEKGADDFILKADTTPKQAVERVLKLLGKEKSN